MSGPNGSAAAASEGPQGIDALEIIATQGAMTVSRRAGHQPGDFMIVIRGTIVPGQIRDLGWEWFWRPPSDRSPETGPISTDEEQETAT